MDSILLAKAIVCRAHAQGIAVSNLKLQKLAYYCQGYTLALTGEALFDGAINAWEHGPVVPAIYHEFKGFGRGSITPDLGCFEVITEIGQKVIDFVLEQYGNIDAWGLVHKTHTEAPWQGHLKGNGIADGQEITHEELKMFFDGEALNMQDTMLARVLDANEVEQCIELPSSIQTEDDFFNWLQGA